MRSEPGVENCEYLHAAVCSRIFLFDLRPTALWTENESVHPTQSRKQLCFSDDIVIMVAATKYLRVGECTELFSSGLSKT